MADFVTRHEGPHTTPRKTTPVTVHHRYRLEHGIYPEPMRAVVSDLCDEIERLQQVVEEIDGAFWRWRHEHREEAKSDA